MLCWYCLVVMRDGYCGGLVLICGLLVSGFSCLWLPLLAMLL